MAADDVSMINTLLAGSAVSYELEIPAEILYPVAEPDQKQAGGLRIQLKPLTIGNFQLILKAGKQDPALIPLLMVRESLVEPRMNLEQIKNLHIGLITFLIEHIRDISGLSEKKN